MKNDNAHSSAEMAETKFGKYAAPLVHEAIAQANTLEADPDAEVLHRLRVALRRLRTLLWAYRPILDKEFDAKQRAIYKFLATAAGNTRDWDILLQLLNDLDESELAAALHQGRDAALKTSRETLSHASIKNVLHDALSEANKELNTAHRRTPLRKFASKRMSTAQQQLKKRIKHATRAKGADYTSFHEVRKAGKKVRYLLEFFEPLLDKKQRKGMKQLKRLQKRFGALNDVVASRALLESNTGSLPDRAAIDSAMRSLKKEEKRRVKAASKML